MGPSYWTVQIWNISRKRCGTVLIYVIVLPAASRRLSGSLRAGSGGMGRGEKSGKNMELQAGRHTYLLSLFPTFLASPSPNGIPGDQSLRKESQKRDWRSQGRNRYKRQAPLQVGEPQEWRSLCGHLGIGSLPKFCPCCGVQICNLIPLVSLCKNKKCTHIPKIPANVITQGSHCHRLG